MAEGTEAKEQDRREAHHAAGTQDSLLEALFCDTLFFFFSPTISCGFISLDG